MNRARLQLEPHHTLPSPEHDMESLLQIEKHRLIEMHAAEASSLRADITGWQQHASGLGDAIRRYRTRENWLWIGIATCALLAGYFAVRDLGCAIVPWWGK